MGLVSSGGEVRRLFVFEGLPRGPGGRGGRVQARAAQAGSRVPWSPLPGLPGLPQRHLPSPLAPGPAWPLSVPLFHEICARHRRGETGSGAGALLISRAGKAAAARGGQQVRQSVRDGEAERPPSLLGDRQALGSQPRSLLLPPLGGEV